MNIYNQLPTQSFDYVAKTLTETGHESILPHISKNNNKYVINKSIHEISPLPTYKFAVACALASLGNIPLANEIENSPNRFIEPKLGDRVSTELFNKLIS